MQLKSTQIIVTLNLDCFRRVSLYSDCIYTRRFDRLPRVNGQSNSSPTFVVQNVLEKCTQLLTVNSMPTI